MKKSSVFKIMTIAFVAMSIMFVSCSKDDEVVPTNQHPTNNTNNTNNTDNTNNQDNTDTNTNKISDGTNDFTLVESSSSKVSGNENYIHTSAKIDGAYDKRSNVVVRIAGGKFSTTKKTYDIGDFNSDVSLAFVSVVLIPDNRTPFKQYHSMEGTPSGKITIEPDTKGVYTITGENIKVYSGTESMTYNFSYTITPCTDCSDIPVMVDIPADQIKGDLTVDGKKHPVASSTCGVQSGKHAFQITNGQTDGRLLIGLSVQFKEGETGAIQVTNNPLTSPATILLTDNSISYVPSKTGSISVAKDANGEFTIEFTNVEFKEISGTNTKTVSVKFTCK